MDIERIFNHIQGDFNFPNIYNDVINRFCSGSTFVEIGTYKGKSLTYLIKESRKKNKKFNLFGIDNFVGVKGYNDDDLEKEFWDNMTTIIDEFVFLKGISWDLANQFTDGSVDFVFVDGGHDYHSVRKDVSAWLPKIKKGGVMGGHDYNGLYYPDLVWAVNQILGDKIDTRYIHESCWFYENNT